MPTARRPSDLASCPTIDPTGPVAAATTSVSPALGLPISCNPYQPVKPGMPSTPRLVVIGAASGSILRHMRPSATAWVAQPKGPIATSPGLNLSELDAMTSPTPPPSMVPPMGTAAA